MCACACMCVLYVSGAMALWQCHLLWIFWGCYFLPFLFPSLFFPSSANLHTPIAKTLIALILQLTYKHTCIPAHLLCARGQVVFQSCNVDPASLAAEVVASGDNIGSMIGGIVAQIGENIQLQRACTLELTAPGVLGRCVPTLSQRILTLVHRRGFFLRCALSYPTSHPAPAASLPIPSPSSSLSPWPSLDRTRRKDTNSPQRTGKLPSTRLTIHPCCPASDQMYNTFANLYNRTCTPNVKVHPQ